MSNENPLISVIVPVYNVGEFLIPCLDSLKGQTYQNLEILLIDDGSTDGSNKVCDTYAEKDSRFKAIHKENGGVSSARNLGLDMAKGAYIAFVDADDRVLPDYFEVLFRDLTEQNVDAAFCNCRYVDEVGADLPRQFLHFYERARICNLETLMTSVTKFGVVWKGLFSAPCLQGYRFSSLRYGEDSLFMFDWLCSNPTVSVTPYIGYLYLQHQNSATNTQKTPQITKEMDHLTLNAHRYFHLPVAAPHIQRQFLNQYAHAYMRAQAVSNGMQREALAEHRRMISSRKHLLSRKVRLVFFLCSLAPWLYTYFFQINKKLRG